MAISDAVWKGIEKDAGATLSNTGIGAELRAYEAAKKKLTEMGVKDVATAKGKKDAAKHAEAAKKAMSNACSLMVKAVRAKKVPSTPAGQKALAFSNEMAKEEDLMEAIMKAAKG